MFGTLTARPAGLQALGYVGVASDRLDDWADLASGLLGMQLADSTRSTRAFRMDDRRQRILVSDDPRGNPRGFFGWEVADAAALDAVANRLDEHQVPHEPMGTLAGERFVRDGLRFRDPAGNQLEIVYGPAVSEDPFRPGRCISGFRTGVLGLGHAVLTTPDVEGLARFYAEVLGFAVSDYFTEPFKACFFHLNPRHHTFALVEMPFAGVHHLMVEMMMMDDVGQAYDIALTREDAVNVTLGRHTNDYMFSFYANTPSKFMVECGWGGRTIDPDGWQPAELHGGPSLWGHERGWLDEAGRAAARAIRMDAAARGSRARVQVQDGNYDTGINCRWFSGAKGSTT